MDNKASLPTAVELEAQLKQLASKFSTKYIESSDPMHVDYYFYPADTGSFDSQIRVPDLEYLEQNYSREKMIEGYLTCLHELGHNDHWEQIENQVASILLKEDSNWNNYSEQEKDFKIENVTETIFFGKDTLESEYIAIMFALENSLLNDQELLKAKNTLAVKLRTYVVYEYTVGNLNLDAIKNIDAVIIALDFADDAEFNQSFTEDDLLNIPQVKIQDLEEELYRRVEKDNIFKFKDISNKYTDQIWNGTNYYAKLGTL